MPGADVSNATTFPNGEREPPAPLPTGQIIGGKYAIKRVLGMGGSGGVYEGEHVEVGHRVAIKVVHRDLTEREETIARFRREARICGSLRHPHVGQVYDVGTLDDGSPYMVMELQEGRSLADVLSESVLPIAATIDIARQLLAGLEAAHNAGFIHRDVKPDNVMIVRDRSGDVVVKLVDFGISKPLGNPSNRSTTRDGMIVGTPDYMAPEQLRGLDLDARTDLYAVGVLLYEALTGRMPFESENLTDLMVAIVRDPVRSPASLRADCPPEIERIVLKAMARLPAQRYRSAEEMSRALAEARARLQNAPPTNMAPLSAPPPRHASNTRTRARRTIDAHALDGILVQPAVPKRSPAVMISVALAAALGIGALIWALAATRPADEMVVAPLATPQPVPSAQPAVQVPSNPTGEQPSTDVAPQATAVAPRLVLEPLDVVENSRSPARTTSPTRVPPQTTSPRRHSAPAQQAREIKRPAPPGEAAQVPATQDVLPLLKQAASAFATGQFGRARDIYREIVSTNPAQADAWRGLVVASMRMGQRAEAEQALRRYLELRPGASDAARLREQLDKVSQ